MLADPALLLATAQAQGTEDPSVVAPSDCGSSELLVSRLRGLGASPGPHPAWSSVVQIGPQPGGGFVLRLAWAGERRQLRDTSCQALFDSAVVILAVAMGVAPPVPQPTAPSTQVETKAVVESSQPSAPPPAEPEPAAEPDPERAHTASAPISLAVGVGGVLMGGVLPAWSPGAELAVAAVWGGLTGLVDLHVLSPSTRGADAAHAVRISGLGGRLLLGYQPADWLGLRAGPSLTRLAGRGSGAVVQAASGVGLRIGAGAELALRTPLPGPLHAELALAGDLSLTRPRFQMSGFGTVFRVPAWATSLRLRLLYQLD